MKVINIFFYWLNPENSFRKIFLRNAAAGFSACAFLVTSVALATHNEKAGAAGKAQKSPSDAENFPADFRQLGVEPFGARNHAV